MSTPTRRTGPAWKSGLVAAAVVALLMALVLSPLLSRVWPPFAALLPVLALLLSLYALVVWLLFGVPLVWAQRFDRAEAQRAADRADDDQPDGAPMPAAGALKPVVLLIHGTFARDATWVGPDSPLAQGLQALATVLPFRWNGANSMRSRQRAVERLREHVARLAAVGHGPFALIGHSHAGNIVLKACEDPATAARVRAIVCLNTPFISAWQPALDRKAGPLARLGLCVLAAGLGMAFWMLGAPFVDPLQPVDARAIAVFAGCAALALPAALSMLRLALRMRVDFDAPPPEVLASVCQPAAIAPLQDRTLILSRAGDEADGVLKLASTLNRQLLAGARLPDTGHGLVSALSIHAGLQAGLLLLGALTSLAFGTNGLRHPTGLCYTSSETPEGQWTHRVLAGGDDQADLYHSSLYGDPRVVAEIRSWIERHTAG